MGGAGELGCVPFHGGISEDICSAALFKNKYGTTGAELYQKAKSGDKESLAVFDELAHNIGELLRMVTYVLAPEAFVIGGSVANSWDLLEKTLREDLNSKFLAPMISKEVDLVKAELDNAGLYGAAALCISQMD
jgi:glucokinase